MLSKPQMIDVKNILSFLALLTMATGCGEPGISSVTHSRHQDAEPPVFHLVTHAMPSDPFWSVVKKGWEDACRRYQIDGRYLGVRTDGNVGEMLGNLETVVATGSNGIACVITDQQALEPPLRRAIANEVARHCSERTRLSRRESTHSLSDLCGGRIFRNRPGKRESGAGTFSTVGKQAAQTCNLSHSRDQHSVLGRAWFRHGTGLQRSWQQIYQGGLQV